MTTRALILAAGQGTRMKSALPKVLHPLGGRPMLAYVLETALQAGADHVITVISAEAHEVEAVVKDNAQSMKADITTAVQEIQKGTAHAALAAREVLTPFEGDVFVLFGDTPLITPEILCKMQAARHDTQNKKPAIVVLGMRPQDPREYARIECDAHGDVTAIVEHRDASPQQLENPLCNSGVMLVDGKKILEMLEEIGCDNAKGEYYLTDLVTIAQQKGERVCLVEGDPAVLNGINTRKDLAEAEEVLQDRWRKAAMDHGVTLKDPKSVFFSYDTQIGQDITIGPNVVFGPGVTLEDHVTIRFSCEIEGAYVCQGAVVGPFAHIRPGTSIGREARVGNFVEVKNATLGHGAKANHLSYLGDADIGRHANIGAGTITCNYDGFKKHPTKIGEYASIGANTSLVAPVEVGDKAMVGAGSVITRKVLPDALAYTRPTQQEVIGGATRFRRKRMKLQLISQTESQSKPA